MTVTMAGMVIKTALNVIKRSLPIKRIIARETETAEDGGFEPPRACTQHAFQACAIGH